jgi:hypothetical protein
VHLVAAAVLLGGMDALEFVAHAGDLGWREHALDDEEAVLVELAHLVRSQSRAGDPEFVQGLPCVHRFLLVAFRRAGKSFS